MQNQPSTSSQRVSHAYRGDAVPVFNPQDRNQTIESWCAKIDELRVIFHWSEDTTIYYALAKLQGLAETWYKGLTSVKYSWSEWKIKLCRAFPSKRDFCEDIKTMLKRRKTPHEDFDKYYYEKLALVNACHFSGRNAVSCIIEGIDDLRITTAARAADHPDPESLFNYLRTVSVGSSTSHTPQNRHQKHTRLHNKNHEHCFICGKTGHKWRTCKERPRDAQRRPQVENRDCSYCKKPGHKEVDCYRKKNDQKFKTAAPKNVA